MQFPYFAIPESLTPNYSFFILNSSFFFLGVQMIAKAISRNPKNVMVGPTTMRRVLNISGLNSVCEADPPPLISRKPIIIIARQHPIIMKLVRVKGI